MPKKKRVLASVLSIFLFVCPYLRLQAQSGESVRIAIKILNQNGNPAQIPFNPTVPLVISDFQGRPDRLSNGVAATRSGIEMNMSGRKQNNQVAIEVELFVYFDKSKSWIKEAGKNPRILNHEQHHLDITALQLCKFIREIKTYSFSLTGWDAELKSLYSENMKELQNLQNRYDQQTSHGTNGKVQAVYDQNVTGELKDLDCFKK